MCVCVCVCVCVRVCVYLMYKLIYTFTHKSITVIIIANTTPLNPTSFTTLHMKHRKLLDYYQHIIGSISFQRRHHNNNNDSASTINSENNLIHN